MVRRAGLYTALTSGLLILQAPDLALGGSGREEAPRSRGASASRSLASPPASAPLPLSELPQEAEPDLKETHGKGPRPGSPKSRLPDDVKLSIPNAKARRSIAEGATMEELAEGTTDDELSILRQAEQVLFPQQVRGLRPGWSFELPEPGDEDSRTLGLPLSIGSDAEGPGVNPEDLSWLGSLTLPDLPIRLDRRVVTYLKFYRDSHRGRTIAAIWTKKSGRYIAEMKTRFRRAGLPTDLVWLSMIESGHDPSIASPAGAVGLWQFMPESGRMYGLTVDRWVDERRDPARATQAAIRFLGDLHRRFGNWELAMGAYNMGYAGMSRAIAKYNTNDYWTLAQMESGIPWETTLYVPKIFALAIVMNNREAFGVGRTKIDPAESFDTILVSPATALTEVASAAGVVVEQLRAMNPQYVASRLPPQSRGALRKWPVLLPAGSAERTLLKLEQRGGAAALLTHRVRLGDTVDRLAEDFGVTSSALRLENALNGDERLDAGTVLVLPKGSKEKLRTEPLEIVVSRDLRPEKGQRVVYYQTRANDDLAEIAHALQVNVADLARYNALSPDAHLRADMTLQAMVADDAKLHHVRHTDERHARVFLAGSEAFHEHFEAQKGKKRVEITVQKGDSLAGLGRRYGMSVGSMERVNRRSRLSELVPGEHLLVYTEQKATDQGEVLSQSQLPSVSAPLPEALPREAP